MNEILVAIGTVILTFASPATFLVEYLSDVGAENPGRSSDIVEKRKSAVTIAFSSIGGITAALGIGANYIPCV